MAERSRLDKEIVAEYERLVREGTPEEWRTFVAKHQEVFDREEQARLNVLAAKKRKSTHQAKGKLGHNQQLILNFIRIHPIDYHVLMEAFTAALFPPPTQPKDRARARLRYCQAIRTLQNRQLIKKQSGSSQGDVAHKGRSGSTIELTHKGQKIIKQKKPAALDDLVIILINKHIDRKDHMITAQTVRKELNNQKINGEYITANRIGRILRHHLVRGHAHNGNIYVLPSKHIAPPKKEKKLKKNWKRQERWESFGPWEIRIS
jgi:hypothetical protein